jgi:zinc protease
VVEGVAKQKPTDEEVERARRKILADRELRMASSSQVGIELSEWGALGDWRLFFLHRDRIKKVTPENVARVASRYLQRSNRTIGLYIPSEQPAYASIPPTPAVADLVKDYKGGESMAAGEAFEPTPENIEKRTQRLQLPCGVKVALLPKKTRGEVVVAELTMHYGNEKSLQGLTSATQFLGPLMMRGTKKHTRQQIQDELDKLGARVHAGGLLGEVTFSITAKRNTLPDVLRLLGEVLREPTFPAAELDILKRETRDALEKGLTEPKDLAVRYMSRQLNPYSKEDIRYVPTIEESIARLDAVTLDQVRKLYTEQLSSQVGELAVVGDFDPATTPKLAEEILKDWKATVPFTRIARPAKTDVAGAREVIVTPDKANAVFIAAHMLALTDSDPDYPALEMANFLFGGGSLSSRLGNRVRQKEGLSYGVGSMFSADSRDKSARFMMFAICNPGNIDKVDQAIAEELEKLQKSGITAEELAPGVKAYLERRKVQRASDDNLASSLVDGLFDGRTFAYHADLDKKIEALTPEDVGAAFRKYIAAKKLVIVRAGDFKKK